MASGWICGQTARDFTVTKTGRKGAMDIQKAEEFKTSKFFCKTNFDMDEIKKEEADYANYPLPKFYVFESPDAKERMLSQNFSRINQEVDDMIKHIQTECKKKVKQIKNRKSMKKYDLYIFFLGLITGIFLTVIIAICYNNYYNQESSDITFFEKPKDFIPMKNRGFSSFG